MIPPPMRTIAVVTSSRADYSHLHWVLRDLAADPRFRLRLVAMAAQLAPDFGLAVREIEADGFSVDERVECLLSSDTDVGMAKTIGVAALGLAEVLGRMRPDLLLLIADRYEMLAPAAVALALRVPVAHIEGGEVSEGAIDDAVRNALTKLAHVHLTPTEAARRRVLAMGEEPWRVHRTGAPSLDWLVREPPVPRPRLEADLGFPLPEPLTVVAYHPVTVARDTLRETHELFAALECLDGPILFCFPNADAGSRALIERARAFCASRDAAHLVVNLHPRTWWGVLRHAALLVGNSSSGIMETPSLGLPAVNVGLRQRGRERAANIVDCEPDRDAIGRAVAQAGDPAFRAAVHGASNPYGDGRAAGRIVEVLATVPLGEELLLKRAVP